MLIADTHVHLYSCYDRATAVRTLAANLRALDGSAVLAGFLAEGRECDAFSDVCAGNWTRDVPGCGVEPAEPGAVRIAFDAAPACYLFAGRQIVTAERIEILALLAGGPFEDGLSAADTVAAVRDAGGVPVLSWAPGKWFGARGRAVRALIAAARPGDLALGDTTLRPPVWREPVIMREARQAGFTVLCGSDPLPFAGEEQRLGIYASRFAEDLDEARPVTSVRRLLGSAQPGAAAAGRRGGTLSVLRRLWRNARVKRQAGRQRG